MLAPKRSKYRKAHKGRVHGLAKGGTELNFGAYGLKASDPGRITARQIEAARRAITRHIRRAGRVWIRIFPDVPVSQKPAEVRMGSGKGSPEFWICRVKPGRIMFELDGVTLNVAREAFELAAAKLPIAARFVVRPGEETGCCRWSRAGPRPTMRWASNSTSSAGRSSICASSVRTASSKILLGCGRSDAISPVSRPCWASGTARRPRGK